MIHHFETLLLWPPFTRVRERERRTAYMCVFISYMTIFFIVLWEADTVVFATWTSFFMHSIKQHERNIYFFCRYKTFKDMKQKFLQAWMKILFNTSLKQSMSSSSSFFFLLVVPITSSSSFKKRLLSRLEKCIENEISEGIRTREEENFVY